MEARLAIRHPTRSVTVPTAPQLLGAYSNQQLAWFSAFSTALFRINDPSLSLQEISFLLGFSELSAYSRDFRRRTGQTPGAVRDAAS